MSTASEQQILNSFTLYFFSNIFLILFLFILGEQLFTAIYPLNSELAGKITGMILEMSQNEIVGLLNSGDLLKAKVDEAVKVLSEHADKPIEAE